MAKPLKSWLVPSFLQHNLRLAVSGCCLHISVMKFWNKFASLQQVNSPSSWAKFQKCCADMYLIRFYTEVRGILRVFVNFADLPEFCGSATAWNIRSPDEWDISTIYTIMFRLFDRSLHPMGCMPWIILRLWGFLCIRDAGCRGNKITDTVWKNNSIARHSACSKVSPQSIG